MSATSSSTINRSLQKVDSLLKSDRLDARKLKKNSSDLKHFKLTKAIEEENAETKDGESLKSEETIPRLPTATSLKNLRECE